MSVLDPGLVALVDARAKATAVLDAAFDALDPRPTVVGPLDAVEPPCVRIGWAEPWLEPFGQAGVFSARLEAFCIAARIEPETGFEAIEELVTRTAAAFTRDVYPWPVSYVGAPRAYEVAGKSYLAAQIVLRLPAGVE